MQAALDDLEHRTKYLHAKIVEWCGFGIEINIRMRLYYVNQAASLLSVILHEIELIEIGFEERIEGVEIALNDVERYLERLKQYTNMLNYKG